MEKTNQNRDNTDIVDREHPKCSEKVVTRGFSFQVGTDCDRFQRFRSKDGKGGWDVRIKSCEIPTTPVKNCARSLGGGFTKERNLR